MNETPPTILTVAVRDLIEFVCQRGSLASAKSFAGPRRALEGARGHRAIVRSRPEAYQSEVFVQYDHAFDGFTLRVQGRLDGLLETPNARVLEEIKTTLRPAPLEPDPLHLAQARLYGFLFLEAQDPDCQKALEIQITYAELPHLEQTCFRSKATPQELRDFALPVILNYGRWLEDWRKGHEIRNASARTLAFPFGLYRQGQRKLSVEVYRAIRDGVRLIAEAPTGIGKTMATLFAAVKSLEFGHADKLVYLTAKTTGRASAEEAVQRLIAQGLNLRCLSISARDSVCFEPEGACQTRSCRFCERYFDGRRDALNALFHKPFIDRDGLREIAETFQVCPFELSLDAAHWSDLVICDFNYALDPSVASDRIRSAPHGETAWLVDEAHNLVDRARDMHSSALDSPVLLKAARSLRKSTSNLSDSLRRFASRVTQLRSSENTQLPRALEWDDAALGRWSKAVDRLVRRMEAGILQTAGSPPNVELMECYYACLKFQKSLELHGEEYRFLLQNGADGIRLKHFCMDPSKRLAEYSRNSRCVVYFSGTLAPFDYFRHFFGGGGPVRLLRLTSPFPRENFSAYLNVRLDAAYRHRDRTRDAIAESIDALIRKFPGNHLVFASSYNYLASLFEAFMKREPPVRAVIQKSGMDAAERAAFIEGFRLAESPPLVGFAVLGGSFGEGVDLVGDYLKGAIVVGVGLPQICLERNLIRDYFDRTLGGGFHFAYRAPGMIRVLQAAGRVIRSETDQGMAALIDRRFREPAYRDLLPEWWDVKYLD